MRICNKCGNELTESREDINNKFLYFCNTCKDFEEAKYEVINKEEVDAKVGTVLEIINDAEVKIKQVQEEIYHETNLNIQEQYRGNKIW